MKKFLQLGFIPRNADFGLLLLRVVFGVAIVWLYGWAKLMGFSKMSGGFPDPLGIGSALSLGLVVFAELVCGALVVIGLFTRLAALILAVELGIAFAMVHRFALGGPNSGQLALLFCAGFLVLVVSGAGKFSADRQ